MKVDTRSDKRLRILKNLDCPYKIVLSVTSSKVTNSLKEEERETKTVPFVLLENYSSAVVL